MLGSGNNTGLKAYFVQIVDSTGSRAVDTMQSIGP